MTNLPTGDFPYMPAQGWQCGVCKAVMAPNTPCCFYCKPKETVTTAALTDYDPWKYNPGNGWRS